MLSARQGQENISSPIGIEQRTCVQKWIAAMSQKLAVASCVSFEQWRQCRSPVVDVVDPPSLILYFEPVLVTFRHLQCPQSQHFSSLQFTYDCLWHVSGRLELLRFNDDSSEPGRRRFWSKSEATLV